MKRPLGITILSTALACLAAVGLVNGFFEFFADREFASPVFSGLAFLYGITALVSAVALWGMRRWAYQAFLVWIGAAVLSLLYFQLRLFRLDWLPLMLFAVFAIVLFALLERYVRSMISPGSGGPAK
ncbi:MAG: hypothetical protein HYT78_12915 [Deltaproteobacteria bacterium]|nr:hypothetical protein [Deltaproteobacteria bacterium]